MLLIRLILVMTMLLPIHGKGQTDSTSSFVLSLEFRPRLEYRNGFSELPVDTSKAAAFVSQRTRLFLTYQRPKFKFHTSLQDIRVWGQYGSNSTDSGFGIFEAFAEAGITKKWGIRIGRQAVELDNGRLFSRANWSQASRAHEGINIIYRGWRIQSELMTFYNQSGEQLFANDYSPTTNYTSLSIHYFNMKVRDNIDLTLINSADGFQKLSNSNIMYVRGTSGGRINFKHKKLNLSAAGYYQYGQLQSGQQISAYYIQPEIKVTLKKLQARLGVEYMSGDDVTVDTEISHSFQPLYGVSFKFMGNLNHFTSFPSDVGGGGLINPYIFLQYKITPKIKLKLEGHTFFLENNVIMAGGILDPFLGIESDLKFKYTFNDFTSLESGIAYMLPSESLARIQYKTAYGYRNPLWGFVMVTFKPELLNINTKLKKSKMNEVLISE
jgi:hypothetical protein